MTMLSRYLDLLASFEGGFTQQRTADRAAELSVGFPACLGRHTITSAIAALGRAHQDWSADYKFFSRSEWDIHARFAPVMDAHVEMFPTGPIAVALDDTKAHKTGKKIPSTFWQRDPLSPPFRTNLMWGQRFLHFALIFPLHRHADVSARTLPIRFEDAPAVKKPGARASDEQWKQYKALAREQNLSTRARDVALELRREFDQRDQTHRPLLLVGDGSFCNRTFFREPFDRTNLLVRTRKDARLCLPAAAGSRRRYDPNVFTPESVRIDDSVPYQETKVFFGGKLRKIRFKSVARVLWRRGSAQRPVRLIVVAPVPYKLSPNARTNYRQPAYLLTDDLTSSTTALLQAYFDRWQIEVNHREIKTYAGAGEAQVRATKAVPRLPAFVVSCYSLLHLAALREFGPTRTDQYSPLPAWRRKASRPSIADLMRRLRTDLNETRVSTTTFNIPTTTLALSPVL